MKVVHPQEPTPLAHSKPESFLRPQNPEQGELVAKGIAPRVYPIPRVIVACALAVGLVGLALAIHAILQGRIGAEPLLLLFVTPVLFAAYLGGYRAGICALGAGVIWLATADQWVASSLGRGGLVQLWELLWLTAVGGAVIAVTEALHRARRRDRRTLAELGETKHALSESVREAKQLQAALEASSIVALTNERGAIISANDRFCAISGYSREELLGQDHRLFNSGYHSKAFFSDLWGTLRAGKPWHGEVRNRAKDGSYYWLDTTLVPLTDDAGSRRYIGIRADITQRKEAELTLRESEHRFRQLTETLPGVFWIYDTQTKHTLYLSPAFRSLTGRPLGDPTESRRVWLRAIHAEDRERVRLAVNSEGGVAFDQTYRLARADGALRWVHERGYPLRDDYGQVFRMVGMAEDVTARRELEHQLSDAQKTEAVNTLAGGVAHEFNNILACIIGYTELVQMSLEHQDPVMAGRLDAVLAAGARAADLVKQMFAFSGRGEASELEVLCLRPLVTAALKPLRESTCPTVHFDIQIQDTDPVRANSAQMTQVLVNLCANAARAMRGRPGTLTVALANHAVEPGREGVLGALPAGPYVRLTIGDTGEGMSHELIKRIFEPFFTTRSTGEGRGLGLAVVQGIVGGHGGVIEVESDLGVGSRFSVYLPAHRANPVRDTAVEKEAAESGQGKHIVLVDDESLLLEIERCVLEKLGYRVTAFVKPEEALLALQAHPAGVDLVITDFTMPGMTGLDLARALQKIRADLPILLATGRASQLSPERLRADGICDILPKPFDLKTLKNEVHRILNRVPLSVA